MHLSSSLTISDAHVAGAHGITIQSESVIHTRARLESALGPILIGRRCVVQERACVGARVGSTSAGAGIAVKPPPPPPPGDGAEPVTKGGVVLGDYVTVEVGAVVEAGYTEIGEGTRVGVGARVGAGCKIGRVGSSGSGLSQTRSGEREREREREREKERACMGDADEAVHSTAR
jgi:dynactin-6